MTNRDAGSSELPSGVPSDNYRGVKVGEFRAGRRYLADHVFLSVGGGEIDPPDLIDEETWHSFIDLPTDVLLRTTDYLGSMVADMHDQWTVWLEALPLEPTSWPMTHPTILNVIDELQAVPFIGAHGWYRQAAASLRNALEAMVIAGSFELRSDQAGYDKWLAGNELGFGNRLDVLAETTRAQALDAEIGGLSLFARNPNGVLASLHAHLSSWTHGAPGFTNGDVWSSNGPVFIPRGYASLWIDFCDVSLAAFALLKLINPSTVGSTLFRDHADTNASARWQGRAGAMVDALQLDS